MASDSFNERLDNLPPHLQIKRDTKCRLHHQPTLSLDFKLCLLNLKSFKAYIWTKTRAASCPLGYSHRRPYLKDRAACSSSSKVHNWCRHCCSLATPHNLPLLRQQQHKLESNRRRMLTCWTRSWREGKQRSGSFLQGVAAKIGTAKKVLEHSRKSDRFLCHYHRQ